MADNRRNTNNRRSADRNTADRRPAADRDGAERRAAADRNVNPERRSQQSPGRREIIARMNKRRKRKKVLLAVEIVLVVILCLGIGVVAWGTKKLNLVQHVELDRDKVKTSSEANAEKERERAEQQQQIDIDEASSGETTAAEVEVTPEPTPEPTGLTGVDTIALIGIDTRDLNDVTEGKNSDTMIIAVIDHNNQRIKLVSLYRDTLLNIGEDYYGTPDTYDKANAAYNLGSAEQFLSMVNLNMDFNITEFITVDFRALTKVIDLLGGLDISMTRQEVVHLNNYNYETSQACGEEYVELQMPPQEEFDGAQQMVFHCTGTQATSYARIRYTEGGDFRRASRQRHVLELIKEKAKSADFGTLNAILDAVLPLCYTNMDNGRLLGLIQPVLKYSMTAEDQCGFPFVHVDDDGTYSGDDCVIPVTLEYNVQLLHNFLFPEQDYYPSWIVQEYSQGIINIAGFDASYIEKYAAVEDNAEIPGWNEEMDEEVRQWRESGGQ
ncbi:MAG: LCP family protein [Eubacterium sp.]|nr:LCP family protein [Eubacterium sp.]